MYDVSSGYLEHGRSRQKQRTRDQLVAAARRLIENGETPRVEQAAEAAGVSRTSAYRYFASRAELLAAAFPETVATSMLPVPAPGDVRERVTAVARAIISSVEQTERQQRAMLRLSLEDVPHELPLRQGRAIAWFREALEPLYDKLGDEELHRLAVALRSVCGIETRVWLHDVAGLGPAATRELQLWMVEALLARSQADPPSDGPAPASDGPRATEG